MYHLIRMGITEIFSTSFLICLAICLILVGALFMYFNQKLNDQNHKITSMFDLVSTMAEEVNSAKQYVQLVMNKVGLPMNIAPVMNNNVNSMPVAYNGGSNSNIKENNSNLIPISEDEDEDGEDEDGEDEEEDEEDEEDEEEDDDDEEEDDDDDEDDDEEDDEDESYSGLNFEKVANESASASETANNEDEDEDELKVDEFKNLKTVNINFTSEDLSHDLSHDLSNDDNNNIDNEQENDVEIESEDLTDLTDLNVKNIEVLDYKKLSLNRLRSIVTEKGIITDASKLKKHELLKLLEVE